MIPSSPPLCPVQWSVTVHHHGVGETIITSPQRTAWKAVASIRCFDGQQPAFSECACEPYNSLDDRGA
jgi:hypothetical protein